MTLLSKAKPWHVDLTGVVAGVACAAGVWVLGVEPVRNAGRDFGRAVMELDTGRRQVESTNAQLAAARNRYESARERLARAVQLRGADSINDELAGLNTLAQTCGLNVGATSPSRARPAGGWSETRIDLRAEGEFSDAVTFLSGVRRQMPDVAVVGFDLSRGANGRVQASYSLVWYTGSEGDAGQDAAGMP